MKRSAKSPKPTRKRNASLKPSNKSLGPVPNLEEHVRPDWWRRIFNSMYLKTDGDVVNDREITTKEVDLFTKILGLSPENSILDLCCGQGRHSLELARRGYMNVEGLDRSHYLIQRAKMQSRKEGLNVKFREGDARKLPYPPVSFDCVLLLGNSFGYFETIQDDIRVLREVHRVLKPWGKFLIDVSDGNYLHENFQPRSWEWIDKNHFVCRERALSSDGQKMISREVICHVAKGVIADQFYAERLYTKESLLELLQTAGFTNISFDLELYSESQRNQDLGMMAKRIIVTAQVRKEWAPIRARKKEGLKRVVVILGDPKKPDPLKPMGVFDDDDLYTTDQMKGALRELERKGQFRFSYMSNHDTLVSDLLKLKQKGKVDLVMNLCDEGYENDARKELHVPALLEILGIPYTGSGPQCLAHCYDKSLVRGVAREMGIPVPKALLIKPGDSTFQLPLEFPVIVKPNFGDSSFGISERSVAKNLEELVYAISEIRDRFGYDKPVLVEDFLTGKEVTVGIIGNPPDSYTVLPLAEEDYSVLPPDLPKICGYEAKWLPDSPYWKLRSIPADLPDDVEKFIVECSLKLFERLGCRDYCRFDWRLDAEGNPKLLEVNPNPGWCWDGHLAKMAKMAKISYPEMLEMILDAAKQRLGQIEARRAEGQTHQTSKSLSLALP